MYRERFGLKTEPIGKKVLLHIHEVTGAAATILPYCINTLKLSENTIHSRINAVKCYFEQVLHRDKIFIDIPRPKKRIILPNLLAISQVERLFGQLENLKHKIRTADADGLFGLLGRLTCERGGESEN